MSAEIRYTSPWPVLDARGRPNPGWADEGLFRYDRRAIKAAPWRIKEWDFYQISDAEFCLQFTFGHAAYAGNVGCMLFDFKNGVRWAVPDKLLALPFGSLHLPASANQDSRLAYRAKGIEMTLETKGGVRELFAAGPGFEARVTLLPTTGKCLSIVVPFAEKPTAFYANQKNNCMAAEGYVAWQAGGKALRHEFRQNAWGILDWGRGVWPFSNEWYWSNGAGLINGQPFGFNLGCGFGDTSHATENVLFYGGASHKLGPVQFVLDKSNYMAPWRLRDTEGRLDLTLTPWYDRTTRTKLLWVDNECHQMFGRFTGTAVLDDGTALAVTDLISFAEHARNNW